LALAEPFIAPLSMTQEARIATTCSRKKSCRERVLCAGKATRKLLVEDQSYVCRHHAIATRNIIWRMYYDPALEAGLASAQDDGSLIGHAWVRAQCSGNDIIIDSYNSIYVEIEKPSAR